MVILNGGFHKLGFFLDQLCLDTQVRGNIGGIFPFLAPQFQEKQWWRFSMVVLNGIFPKIGLFLPQLCLHTPPQ